MPTFSRSDLEKQIAEFRKRASEHLTEHHRYVGACAALESLLQDEAISNHTGDDASLEETVNA